MSTNVSRAEQEKANRVDRRGSGVRPDPSVRQKASACESGVAHGRDRS
jgi:hypothetical protein